MITNEVTDEPRNKQSIINDNQDIKEQRNFIR